MPFNDPDFQARLDLLRRHMEAIREESRQLAETVERLIAEGEERRARRQAQPK